MPHRILIIEDNPANLDLMAYLLTAFGHAVLTANDGEEGLEVVYRERPDLIVCDILMPKLDGYEVARRLKRDPARRAIPLIAITALAMMGDRDKILAAGFDGYITKPIDPETFVQGVTAFLKVTSHSASSPPAPAPTPASAAAQIQPPPGKRVTLMVVDNSPVNLSLARSLFVPFDYEVVTALTAQEALPLVRQAPPDLILSDVHMPETSGYDFLRTVKADPGLRRIPFILISSTAWPELDRQKVLALGAADFITRPIEPPVLLAKIRACLQQPTE